MQKIVRFQETVLLATMFDSNQDPKSFYETKQTQDSSNGWAAMTAEFQNI
jgi:hypothetical protein